MKSNITKQDLLLLMLYLNDSKPITGTIKIQKMMFLLKKEIIPKIILKNPDEKVLFSDFYEFVSFPFGPFSERLNEDLYFFECIRFVKKNSCSLKIDFNSVDDWEQEEYTHIIYEDDDIVSHFGLCRKASSNGYFFQLSDVGRKYVEENILDLFSVPTIVILTALRQKIDSLSNFAILKYIDSNYANMVDSTTTALA